MSTSLPEGTRTVQVSAGGGSDDYPVFAGRGVLECLPDLLRERAPAHRYAVIGDSTVAVLYGERVAEALRDVGLLADLWTFPAGEENKTRGQWSRLTDELLRAGLGRDGAVIAVGGGVTGDLAGFVAASYMRGIPVVQVPTSLVAMIDASVGGKTGVDVPAGKNLVGAFHPPRMVVADPDVVGTLPRIERSQGLAEALKHGAILDAGYFDELAASAEALLDAQPEPLGDAVVRSVELKAGVVSRDEREGSLRQILNFGHTLGHAIEGAAGYELRHGSAISVGMVLEARIGEEMGITESGTADRLAAALRKLELPVAFQSRPEVDELIRFIRSDKKGRRGEPRYVLLSAIGRVAKGESWSHTVEEETVRGVLARALRGG